MPSIILDPDVGQPIEDYVTHDLPLLVKEKPSSLSTESHNCVIMGLDGRRQDGCLLYSDSGYNRERLAIADHLASRGFEVVKDSIAWPRNNYLSFGNTLVASNGWDKGMVNEGAYVFGPDFVIASKSLIKNYCPANVFPRDVTTEQAVRQFWRAFGIEKVYFVPPSRKIIPHSCKYIPGQEAVEETVSDIDYTIGSVPWLGLYTADSGHYEEERKIFKKIEKENKVEFLPVSPYKIDGREHNLWPNNYLALRQNGKTYVMNDPRTVDCLNEAISRSNGKRESIVLQETPVQLNHAQRSWGSIHCFTQTARSADDYANFRRLLDIDKHYYLS